MLTILVLVGCNKTTVSETENNYVQGITATEIKVGNCAATSGAGATIGIPFNAGIQAYFDMVNDAGGVNGRTINFVHEDDEFDPAKGKQCVEDMMNDEKIFALVGHFGTPTIAATLDDVKEKGIPVVYFASGLASLYNENATGEDRGIYPVQPIYVMEGRLIVARAVAEYDSKKIGAIYTSDDAGTDMITGIRNQVNKLGDEYTLVEQQVTPGASDYSAAVAKMKQEGVDVVIVATIQASFTPIVKELAKQNVNKPAFTSYINADGTLIGLVKDDVGTKFPIYANAWVDVSDTNAVTLFATEIVESSGVPLYAANAFSMAGWIAGHYFIEGLKNVDGDLTWTSYMDGIESEPIKNPFGGQIDYSNGKRLGTQEMSLLKMDVTTSTWAAHKPIANLESILGDTDLGLDEDKSSLGLYYVIGGVVLVVVVAGIVYFVVKSKRRDEE
jgi:ABC-type branched-subunit amino acid transport system substrate-binding protein